MKVQEVKNILTSTSLSYLVLWKIRVIDLLTMKNAYYGPK